MAIKVLIREVRNHEVSVIKSTYITVVALLQSTIGLIVSELVEYTETNVVFFVTTSGQNIVSRVIDDHLLWVVNTFRSCYVLNKAGIHVGKGGLSVSIGSIVVIGANNALLINIKVTFARDNAKCER